nr:MAG TPA: hypothetical protein [Caudoviricetes sp.]
MHFMHLAFLLNSAQIIQKFMVFLLERHNLYEINNFNFTVVPIKIMLY